jgi:hypothetical protein
LSGTLIPLSKAGKLDFDAKFGSAALIAGGGILIALGQAILNRSDAASKLAGATASNLGETQTTGEKREIIPATDAGAKCSIALGAWESSRADATAIASTLLEAEKKEGSDAKAKAFDAQGKADAAKVQADAAQAKADKAEVDGSEAKAKADKAEADLKKAEADLKKLQEAGKPKRTETCATTCSEDCASFGAARDRAWSEA